jgi:hypothetical protein
MAKLSRLKVVDQRADLLLCNLHNNLEDNIKTPWQSDKPRSHVPQLCLIFRVIRMRTMSSIPSLLTRSIRCASMLRDLAILEIYSALALPHFLHSRPHRRRSASRHVLDRFLDPRYAASTLPYQRSSTIMLRCRRDGRKGHKTSVCPKKKARSGSPSGCLRSLIRHMLLVGCDCPPSSSCRIEYQCSGVQPMRRE